MEWIVYIICGLLVVLAVYIFIKEIRKMLKGRCCDNCKHCNVKGQCEANEDHDHKEKS